MVAEVEAGGQMMETEADGRRQMMEVDDQADWIKMGRWGMRMGGCGNLCCRWRVEDLVDDKADVAGGKRQEEDQRAGREWGKKGWVW